MIDRRLRRRLLSACSALALLTGTHGSGRADPPVLQVSGVVKPLVIDNSGGASGLPDLVSPYLSTTDDIAASNSSRVNFAGVQVNSSATDITADDMEQSQLVEQQAGLINILDRSNRDAGGGTGGALALFVTDMATDATNDSGVIQAADQSNLTVQDIEVGEVVQDVAGNQWAGRLNFQSLDNSGAAGGVAQMLSYVISSGVVTSQNRDYILQTAAGTSSADGSVAGGGISQSAMVRQDAGLRNDFSIVNAGAASGILDVVALVGDGESVSSSNTLILAQINSIVVPNAGSLLQPDVSQSSQFAQFGGILNSFVVNNRGAGGGIGLAAAVLNNSGPVSAINIATTTQSADSVLTAVTDLTSDAITQTDTGEQTGGIQNIVRVDNQGAAGGIRLLGTNIRNDSPRVLAFNSFTGLDSINPFRLAGQQLDLKGMTQSVIVEQAGGVLNDIDIDEGAGGDNAVMESKIANLAAVDASNLELENMSINSTNQSEGTLVAGTVRQDLSVGQFAGVRNALDIDRGGTSSLPSTILTQLRNDATITAVNYGSALMQSFQSNASGVSFTGSPLSQSISIDQEAGISNLVGLRNTGSWTSPVHGIVTQVLNHGEVSAGNVANIYQNSYQVNASPQDVVAAGLRQSVDIRQFAGVRNDIDIRNDGTIIAAEDGIVTDVDNLATVTAYNFLTSMQVSNRLNNAGGNATGGSTDVAFNIDLFAGVRTRIATANTGHIEAGDAGIVSVIDNSGTVTASNSGTATITPVEVNSSGGTSTAGNFTPEITVQNRAGVWSEIDVSNSGSIEAGGPGIVARITGYDTDGRITVSNSGVLISRAGPAIVLEGGSERVLNLAAPAYVAGVMDLGGSAVVNLRTGKSHSIDWTFAGEPEGGRPHVTGPVPAFYNPDTHSVATLDPTGFNAAYNSLADMTGLISGVIQRRLEGGGMAAGTERLSFVAPAEPAPQVAQAPAAGAVAVPTADVPAPADMSGGWVSVNASSTDQKGNNIVFDTANDALAVTAGYDRRFGNGDRFGVLGGYVAGSSAADSPLVDSYSSDAQGIFAGIYGRKTLEGAFLDYAVTAGGMANSSRRFVNDNLAVLGSADADADYTSFWISPEVALGTVIGLPHSAELIPSVRLRYAGQWTGRYEESGTSANADVAAHQIGVGEASAEIAARQWTYFGSVTGRLGILGRTAIGDDSIDVTLIGQGQSIPAFTESYAAGYAALDVNMKPTDNMDVDLGGQVTYGQMITSYAATAQLGIRF